MDEYTSTWPLWTDQMGQENRPEWRLGERLESELKAWALDFDTHFEVIRGWDTVTRCNIHAAEGRRLQAEVQSALGSEFNVELVLLTAS